MKEVKLKDKKKKYEQFLSNKNKDNNSRGDDGKYTNLSTLEILVSHQLN